MTKHSIVFIGGGKFTVTQERNGPTAMRRNPIPDYRKDMAKRLKALRKEKRVTQVELGERTRLQQPNIAFIETFGPATLASLHRYCEGLGVIVDIKLIDPEKMEGAKDG